MGPLTVQVPTAQQPLAVYPNPVSDVLYVKNFPCEAVEYSIFNVLGQKVMAGFSSETISVAGLGKGLYFLQVKGENFCETAKFVVN
jgi:deoxycytidylate deaminase